MTILLLALVYPFLLAARDVNALTGRDPLRLHEPDAPSLWIERQQPPSDATYFTEGSPAESGGKSGILPTRMLLWLARWYAPPRARPGEKFSAGADREQGIPDEMYTLW
jgi:hypothetical protein